jgi:Ca2+-binding EF-hand superfamily protein
MGNAIKCKMFHKKKREDYLYNNDSIESIEDTGLEIEDKYRGTLVYAKDKEGKLIYMRRKNLVFSNRIIKIKNELNLNDSHCIRIWKFFKTLDPKRIGYITLEKLYNVIGESPSCSSMAHIIDRFFIEIEKEYTDKVNFEELLPYLVKYCLYTPKQIKMFVFEYIDKNRDNFISRTDIVEFLSVKREGENLNLINHPDTIKFTNFITRSDKISFDEFEKLCNKFPFIYYSALLFQTKLKENYVGISFWDKLLEQVLEKQKDNMKMIEKKKIENKIEEIHENIVKEQVKTYKNKKEAIEKKEEERKNKIYQEDIRVKKYNNDEVYYESIVAPYNNFKKEKNELIKSLDNIIIVDDVNKLAEV